MIPIRMFPPPLPVVEKATGVIGLSVKSKCLSENSSMAEKIVHGASKKHNYPGGKNNCSIVSFLQLGSGQQRGKVSKAIKGHPAMVFSQKVNRSLSESATNVLQSTPDEAILDDSQE